MLLPLDFSHLLWYIVCYQAKEVSEYAPVENPVDASMLGKYFIYDDNAKAYRRSKTAIPTAVKAEQVRDILYRDGFDMDGIHYVRYKRSAGASRGGRCLFIAEPLHADMDVADLLGISRAGAYELVKEKGFPKINVVHGRIIVPRDRFFEWLDSRETSGKLI